MIIVLSARPAAEALAQLADRDIQSMDQLVVTNMILTQHIVAGVAVRIRGHAPFARVHIQRNMLCRIVPVGSRKRNLAIPVQGTVHRVIQQFRMRVRGREHAFRPCSSG